MKQQQVYNLKEFAAKYQLKDIFGAYAAHIHTDVLNGSPFLSKSVWQDDGPGRLWAYVVCNGLRTG